MIIRAAIETDFSAIAKLTNYFIRETVIHFGTVEATPEELAAQWAQSKETHPFLVAELDGRFAGYAKAYTWRTREAYQWTPECGVYVEDFARRRGVARALYGRLFDELIARGFHSAIAGIALPNEPSVRLHESVGFVPVGIVKHAGWKLGRWSDVGFWQKSLSASSNPPAPLQKNTA